MNSNKATSVEAYIASFPDNVQNLLKQLRVLIKDCAPDANEAISYGMPAYKLCGKPLVYFAAYKNHIGFYATPSGHSAFAKDLSRYKQGKGSVQFSMKEPLPLELIAKIIAFRVEENERKKSKS
ncbi:uncharacterized protein YdhG (YjbR/CyaY superfamily) [Flavobacteriaceae bacterium MAR_2009_75]|nr:uncharacterized protein YdhG (YjbR/CyaY superfamily) [Flavobacteriaceae bacterium MAR_2009_75]